MFIDARTVENGAELTCDVCIMGGGPAGITIAREFFGGSEDVILLESGGLNYDSETQELFAGTNSGLTYFPLVTTRLRYFGGASNHWGGNCHPFSPLAFEARPWIPESGWPISHADLAPYYVRASEVLGLPDRSWDVNYWTGRADATLPEFSGGALEPFVVQLAPEDRRRFGERYREAFSRSANVRTYLYANVVDIGTDPSARTVTQVQVACLSGVRFRVRARLFVLAVGGIENARLLLSANSVQSEGLGNTSGDVGRYFMDQPRFVAGKLYPTTGQRLGTEHMRSVVPCFVNFAVSAQRQEELKTAMAVVSLRSAYEKWWSDLSDSVGVLSVKRWRGMSRDNLDRYVANIAADLDSVAKYAYGSVVYGDKPPLDYMRCFVNIEPVPYAESRVTLDAQRDRLGMRRANLDWQLASEDKHTARSALRVLGSEAGRTGFGRLKSDLEGEDWDWPVSMEGGHHQVGTTRMSESPDRGVVNRDCRLHQVDNLYVAGSSVFPTAERNWPTYTLLALSLRLADHLKTRT